MRTDAAENRPDETTTDCQLVASAPNAVTQHNSRLTSVRALSTGLQARHLTTSLPLPSSNSREDGPVCE